MAYHLILLAHGSSDPKWRKPFETFHQTLRQRLETPVHLAYMELSEPSLETIVDELAQDETAKLDVLPLFFAAGRHLRKDVPAQIDALQHKHRHVALTLLPPVGEHPAFVDALASVIAEQAGESPLSGK